MNYAEFAAHLKRHPDLELVFEIGDITIRRDYHLTEVLRHTVDAIDCGGAVDHWQETVLQLVEPGHAEGQRFMSAGKAAAILQRSEDRVPLPAASELLLEFRAADAPAAQRFRVNSVVRHGDTQLRVLSEGARTQCKAAERSATACGVASTSSPCCASPMASSSARAENVSEPCCSPIAASTPARGSQGCCA